MRYAILSFSQPYHKIGDKAAAQCAFYVRLSFETGAFWMIGRGEALPNENWIPIFNPACTRRLARITAIKTNSGELHLLECLHDRQKLLTVDGGVISKRPLRNGDRLVIGNAPSDGMLVRAGNLPCQISYKIFDETSGRLDDDTVSLKDDEATNVKN